MRYPRFTSRLLNQPQLIEPRAAAAVLGFLMPGVRMDGWDSGSDFSAPDPREYQIIGSTAVVPVVGELVHRGGSMDAMSGVTSYQALGDMVSEALGDSSVRSIMLDLDSPGGEAAGVLDFAEWLASMRGEKPIVASINSQACSAAYAIASAADKIVLGQNGVAGSIGVVSYHTDISQALSDSGVKLTYIYAGARKIDGAPSAPLSSEAEQQMQGMVDAVYRRFCSVVAANRSIPVESVIGTEAGVFMGPDAITAGLADAIATQEEALSVMNLRNAANGARMFFGARTETGGLTMSAADEQKAPKPATPAQAPAPAAPKPAAPPAKAPEPPPPAPAPEEVPELPTRDDLGDMPVEEAEKHRVRNSPSSPTPASPKAIAAACASAGLTELIPSLIDAEASMGQVSARIDEARQIVHACKAGGMPDFAKAAIKHGLSLDAARELLFTAKAERDQAIRTDTTIKPNGNTPPTLGYGHAVAAAERFASATKPVHGAR